ncbi:hypothetical protein EOK75_12420 (plasmid) [Pseudorhodobacter turbinis]|uniref:Uncharacterized protein n=1 Tax=Pseudorhodobacter turbinis TaxID=2500533 RepID=A0A4P8EI29_9RHOB|nr:hypothetical protein [Pseudorhodobacter turbinis]QCO56626.1 hypothetical protein EOK75_12420 [Pseudorhodobacter turbinis]
MADLATLLTQLAKLQEIRACGTQAVRYEGKEITYRSDAEIAAAIGDLERQIAAAQGRTIRQVRFHTSKGL